MTEQAAKPSGDASGLADIKGIAAALKAADEAPAAGAAGNVLDPGAGFGSGAAVNLLFEQASSPISLADEAHTPTSPILLAVATTPTVSRQRPKGLLVAAAILGVAVAVLGGVALMQGNAAQENDAAPLQAAAAVPTTPPEPSGVADGVVAGLAGAAHNQPLEVAEPVPDQPRSEGTDDAGAAVPRADSGSGQELGASRSRAAAADTSPESEPTRAAEAAPKREPDAAAEPPPDPAAEAKKFEADCILDPTAPGCGGPAKQTVVEEDAADQNLPDKLGNADVRAGFDSVKTKAKGCGVTHGIFPGSKVLVKVSIAGATGKVLSAEAMGEHAGTRGGQCVADHLKTATFKRFKSEVMGVTFPVRI